MTTKLKVAAGVGFGSAAALLILGLLLGCSKPAPSGEFKPPPSPVEAAVAAGEDVPLYLDEIGRIVAREVVSIQPQVSGRITEIHFTDGADVKAGDPLFTIDTRPFQARVEAAEAALAQMRAALELAKIESERVAGLADSRAVSKQEVDEKRNAVSVGEARVKESQAALETAKLNLDYCFIRSPIDGRVGHRLVDLGNNVRANEGSLLVVQRLDPIYADFTTTERNLSAVQAQMAKGALKVEVRLPDEAAAPIAGELTFLDNAVQEESGTVKLRATVPNADHRLWPGRFVKIRLVLDTIKGAVLVPATAPQMSARGPYVFVVSKDSKAEMRPVTIGQRQGDRVVLLSGVQAGEQVVTSSSLMVSPGSPVRVVPAAPAGGHP